VLLYRTASAWWVETAPGLGIPLRAANKLTAREDLSAYLEGVLLDGVSEGLRPGIRGTIQEMRIFCQPWKIPFAAVKAPVILWQGTLDQNVPVPASLRLAHLIPGCELHYIEDAGHYWIFDHIEEVLTAIVKKMTHHHSS